MPPGTRPHGSPAVGRHPLFQSAALSFFLILSSCREVVDDFHTAESVCQQILLVPGTVARRSAVQRSGRDGDGGAAGNLGVLLGNTQLLLNLAILLLAFALFTFFVLSVTAAALLIVGAGVAVARFRRVVTAVLVVDHLNLDLGPRAFINDDRAKRVATDVAIAELRVLAACIG